MFGWFRKKKPGEGRAIPATVSRSGRRYAIGEKIGGAYLVEGVKEGGLGLVYIVEHQSGERIVLKQPKAGLSSSALESFREEAETWARLGKHPNIVAAIWVDEIAGQLFVAAELVEPDELGRVALRDYIQRYRLTTQSVATWLADLCYGLAFAASRGLVAHRDIKPENLLIGQSGRLRITDFGLAQAFTNATSLFSGEATKIGSWQTQNGNVSGTPPYMAPEQWLGLKQDIRTDVYAVGIVLFEMVFARLPFEGPAIQDLAKQHLSQVPIVPDTPFSVIIRKCLAKDPSHRYVTPDALVEELRRTCSQYNLRLPPPPSGSDDDYEEKLTLARSLRGIGKSGEAVKVLTTLADLYPYRPAAWTELGRIALEANDTPTALEYLKRAVDIDPTRSAAWNNLGIALGRLNRWANAVDAFSAALECNPENTGAMANSVGALLNLGRVGEALQQANKAADIAPDVFNNWLAVAAIHNILGAKDEALACLSKALALAPQNYHAAIRAEIMRVANS